jgi:hypothetical protein
VEERQQAADAGEDNGVADYIDRDFTCQVYLILDVGYLMLDVWSLILDVRYLKLNVWSSMFGI